MIANKKNSLSDIFLLLFSRIIQKYFISDEYAIVGICPLITIRDTNNYNEFPTLY